jgi:hypothetical protein
VSARARVCACARAALTIQHAKRMSHTVRLLSGTTKFFDTVSYRSGFSEGGGGVGGVTEYKTYVLIFSTIIISTYVILSKIHRYNVINVKTSSCKVPVIIVRF